jgi:hypothetical protein
LVCNKQWRLETPVGLGTWAPGGRRREFLDLAVELHELLDRRPWEVDVFYVDAMKPSDDVRIAFGKAACRHDR